MFKQQYQLTASCRSTENSSIPRCNKTFPVFMQSAEPNVINVSVFGGSFRSTRVDHPIAAGETVVCSRYVYVYRPPRDLTSGHFYRPLHDLTSTSNCIDRLVISTSYIYIYICIYMYIYIYIQVLFIYLLVTSTSPLTSCNRPLLLFT